VLTQYLLERPLTLYAVELDRESIPVLLSKFPQISARLFQADLLRWQEPPELLEAPFALVGNFPYNISTQILFWMLERRDRIPEMVGMFQREVAVRICSGPGNKDYGITSVLA
jgi:16S rRNA (adenine1518-N6/adenine1519-N6)-dimethyltransferase